MRRIVSLGAVVILALAAQPAQAEPQLIDLVQLQTDDIEAWSRLKRTSDADPLTLEELEKLAAAGIGEATLVEMMRTRRVKAVADADRLIALKKKGATDAVIAAVSAHALPPNDHIDLFVALEAGAPGAMRQAPSVYIELWHTGLARQEALLHADLRRLFRRGLNVEVQRDESDPLLPRTVRRINFSGKVESKAPGALVWRIYAGQQRGLTTLEGLPKAEQGRVQTLPFDYPAVSEQQRCRIDLRLERDAMMKDTYALSPARLDCRWE